MATYEGISTMYLSMSMCSQSLPLLGSCQVNDKKLSLRFPLTTVSFDLPESPYEGMRPAKLNMTGPRGEMTLNIAFHAESGAFTGQCTEGGQKTMSFVFYKPSSHLTIFQQL